MEEEWQGAKCPCLMIVGQANDEKGLEEWTARQAYGARIWSARRMGNVDDGKGIAGDDTDGGGTE